MGVTVTLNDATAKAAQALESNGALEALWRERIGEALAETGPDLSIEEAFAQARGRITSDRAG